MSGIPVEFANSTVAAEPDGRLDAPAFHRNHAPISAVLARFFQERTGDVLEVGSGTGQHAVAFARAAPALTWWPSDCNDRHLQSIAAWRAHAGLPNLRAPLRIDLMDPDLGFGAQSAGAPSSFLAIVCVNVLHIAPWPAAEGLVRLARRRLLPEGRLFVYGPFKAGGNHTAPSNAAFDASLRRANAEWGVRDIDELSRLAERMQLRLAEIVAMPANNVILAFGRSHDSAGATS
jgi:SAM-dependent methyltransferase